MLRKLIFKDGSTEIALPVTPAEYTVSNGIKIETINLHGVGDINLAGYAALDTIKISCMFPAKKYPFMLPSSKVNPDYYIDKFKRWAASRKVIRFIVSGAKVNVPVYVESITHGEKDGTNDIYADITLREYKALKRVTTSTQKNNSRPVSSATKTNSTRKYTVVRGDTMWDIAHRFYGDATLCYKLAAYNKIKNASLIYPGQVITIPERSKL